MLLRRTLRTSASLRQIAICCQPPRLSSPIAIAAFALSLHVHIWDGWRQDSITLLSILDEWF